MVSALLVHNSDYAGHIDAAFKMSKGKVSRAHTCAIRIQLDFEIEDRFPWLFKGLSVETTNDVFKIISSVSEDPLTTDLDETEIKELCVPYDAMPFTTKSGEQLRVGYSIKPLPSRLRSWILGPQGVSLYEKGIPHFGPIYIFACTEEEENLRLLPITSTVDDIIDSLCVLNFGA